MVYKTVGLLGSNPTERAVLYLEIRKDMNKSAKYVSVGERIGFLTIMEYKKSRAGKPCCVCKCECGKIVVKKTYMLCNSWWFSCGCVKMTPKCEYKILTPTYFYDLKKGASKREIEFNITPRYILDLWYKQGGKCALTGKPLVLSHTEKTASLDRIDSSVGYVKNNVQWIHKNLQRVKGALLDADFIKICKEVAANNI
jgi:hypothetical protein